MSKIAERSRSVFSLESAFTLVEILVAMGVMALIAGFVVLILNSVLLTWSRTSDKIGAGDQARWVLDQLSLDLQSALFRADGAVWIAATILDNSSNSGLWEFAVRQKPAGQANRSLNATVAALAEARFGQAGVWLRFFTTARGTNDSENLSESTSAPVAVSYQIIRRRSQANSPSATGRYLLYRSQVRPAQSASRPGTIESGFDLDPALTDSNYTKTTLGVNDGTHPSDPVSIRRPDHLDLVVGENVIDFGVRFHAQTAGAPLILFPEDENDFEYLGRSRFPTRVDIVIRILTEQGARQIALLETEPNRLGGRPAHYSSDADWWWGIAAANSKVFTRRIVLPVYPQ